MEGMRTWITIVRVFVVGLAAGALLIALALQVRAETDTIRPDGAGTTEAGTAVGCTSSLRWECLNDDVTELDTPDSSDYLQLVNTDTNHSQLGTFPDIDTATSVTIWIYHREGGSNARTSIGLYAANETTAYGGPTTLPLKTSSAWDSVTYSGLSLSQANVDDLRLRISCGKQGGGSSNDCFAYAAFAYVDFSPQIEVTVSSSGSQQNLDIGSKFSHIGGTFVISENISGRNITSITIEENGSVDADNDLKNVALYYDIDNTAGDGYNCSDQSFSPNDQQYGATSTNGFSGDDGTITFSESVAISTTGTLCLYVVTDVATSSLPGDTIEVQITDPSTDVVGSGTDVDVTPATVVALSGQTIIQAQDRDQFSYHWRDDTGNENDPGGSASVTGGSPTTTYDTLGKLTPTRLRIGVSNEGNKDSDATQYRLEYGRKISSCQNVSSDSSWTDVGATGGDWDMYDTGNLTNGNDTTNIAVSIGGLYDPAGRSFLSTNGGQRDTSSQTGSITLTSSQFVELEYSIIASSTATEGYTYCFRLTNAGSPLETYSYYPEATILADVNVSSQGNQKTTIDIPTNDARSGGRFAITDNILGSTTVTSITITASGTVDLQNDIDELELYYEYDITSPLNCAGESRDGSELQYGSTANGFSAAGTSTFTQSIELNSDRALCIYVEYDVPSTVTDGELIDIKIQDASTDVTISSGTVSPAALVDLPVTTKFVTDTISQAHYHWRNDNGSETGATSATGGTEDTTLSNLRRTTPIRLRIGMANLGSSTTPPYQYRLEYALRVSTCGAATGWVDVNATDDEFNLYDSSNITNGGNTTNVGVSSGGVTDVGNTFLSSNGGLRDTTSQTGSITLSGKNYVDLEYSLVASSTAAEGSTYCFRVTDAGTPFTSTAYSQYPKVTIKPRTGFFVQRGVTTISGTSATINAGTQYIAPKSSTTAFIRIVGTHNTGAGSPTNTGNSDDITAHISNPSNIENSITFTRPATAADTTRVSWEIIEFTSGSGGDNEIVVRQASTATYVAANTTFSTAAIPGIVDGDDVVVFITGQSNPDTGTNRPVGLSTANFSSTTNIATFTRGVSGNAAVVSYAVVEFLGDNWKVQRAEHTYSAAGSTETESINAVGSLSRAFIHTQKRMGSGLNNHSDYGHNVYLSGIGQVSFALEAGAASAANHTSVAWVIENTQTIGDTMRVTRSNGSESAGSAPKVITTGIGATISDPQDASLFINNYGNETGGGSTQNSFPEPIYSARLTTSLTQYELWVADPDNDSRSWRAEVVEWPTASRDFEQFYYYFFDNNDALDPTDPWPPGPGDVGENGAVGVNDSPIALGDEFRLRMTVRISAAAMDPGIDAFKLQYGELESTCVGIAENDWHDVGEIGSTTALWRGTSTSQTDGAALSTDPPGAGDLNISQSQVAGTFEEENPSAFAPYAADPGEGVEFDWVVQHNGATEKKSYCFRMTESDGTKFDQYTNFPIMRTAGYTPTLFSWRFYDDETSLTPVSPLAGTNTAPIDIAFNDPIKLRTTIEESTGGEGTDAKFKLQYSLYSDFSAGVYDVVASSTCTASSTWCYADGAGTDNSVIDDNVLGDADACSGGSGAGCGTHNEGVSTTTATFDHPAYGVTEYEFTLVHAGARVNSVYYFRLFDLVNATTVPATTTNPSLVTEGASLVFTVSGLPAGTTTEGIETDATTSSTSISFGSVPLNTEYEGAYRLAIDTNSTEGYQILMVADQLMQNGYGETISPNAGTNASPVSWSAGCDGLEACFGYHVGDDSLSGGSARFAPDDSYAAISTTTYEEVAYSSVPTNEYHDIVYKIQVGDVQPAGDYGMNVSFLVIPVY